MGHIDTDTTNPALLDRLGDWRDHAAWSDFVERYDPVIRSACRRFQFDTEATEELCQRVWIELARRMRTFQYDPGKTFRGWLRRLCRSRAIDLLRRARADERPESLGDDRAATSRRAEAPEDDVIDPERPRLLRQARRSRKPSGVASTHGPGKSSGTSPSRGGPSARPPRPRA